MPNIRPATAEDGPLLLPLLTQLGYSQSLEQLQSRLDLYLTLQDYGVAVAEQSPSILGFIAWSSSPQFVVSRIRIHIEGLVVDNTARGLGIGKKLIGYAEEYARTVDPYALIDLTSGLRRAKDGTHDFYRSLGYGNDGPMAKLYLRKEL